MIQRRFFGRCFEIHEGQALAGYGLGGRLVAWAESWALDRGLASMRLDCWDENTALRRFYRELGYRELQAVESYGTPVRLFEKHLDRTS